MAFGDKFKNWWGSWGDDDTVYEDESSFDDDLWADFGIDPDNDPDTWFDETPTDDPYGIGSLFDPPTGTVNPWDSFNTDYSGVGGGMPADNDPYGIGSYFDNFGDLGDPFDLWEGDDSNFGDWGAPAVDFEDPDFNWGEFDVDSYLDSLLDPDYGGGTEGDPSSWFINSGDPAYQDYSGVGGGMPPSTFDTSLLDELGYDPSTGSVEDWLQSIIPSTEVDQWEDLRDASGNIDPSLFTGPRSRGPLGGGIGPWLRDAFLGEGGLGGKKEGEGIGGILGLLGGLFGKANTAVDTVGSGIGGLFNSTLGQLAMLNYMKNKNKDYMDIPVGWGDGGGGGGDGSPIDYRVFNIQPALMPGVAYANVGKPEGMKYGGSVYPSVNPAFPRPPFDPRRHWTPPQPKKQRGYGQAQEGRDGMKDGGLGDVTLAKLEPGEFVVTKKAVDNVGAQNLYKMMKQWEGRG